MTSLSAPIVDVQPGIMVTTLPPFTAPAFLRLAAPAGGDVDRARQTYLRRANATLHTCTAGWRDGAGVLVSVAPPSLAALTAEVHEVGRALRALGDPTVVTAFLETMAIPACVEHGAGPNLEGD